jgi:hypothetical protein
LPCTNHALVYTQKVQDDSGNLTGTALLVKEIFFLVTKTVNCKFLQTDQASIYKIQDTQNYSERSHGDFLKFHLTFILNFRIIYN